MEDKYINSFCWILRDKIDNFIETSYNPSQNLSNKEKGALRIRMTIKSTKICMKDVDNFFGAATANKSDVINEGCRQLCDHLTHLQLSEDAKNDLIRSIKVQL